MIAQDYRWVDVANITINNTPWTRRADGGLVISLEDVAEMNDVAAWLAALTGATFYARPFQLSSLTSIKKADAERVVFQVGRAITGEVSWIHADVGSFGDHSQLNGYTTPSIYSADSQLAASRALMGRPTPFSAMTPIGDALMLSIKSELAANARRVALTAGPTSAGVSTFPAPFASGDGHGLGRGGNYGNVALVTGSWVDWAKAEVQEAGYRHGSAGTPLDPAWADYFGSSSPQTSYHECAHLVAKMDTSSSLYDAGRYPYGVALGLVYRMTHGWAGDGAPTYSVDTKYVFWGCKATASGGGQFQSWTADGPTMAELVAATGWTLRSPYQPTAGQSGYGDVISAHLDGIGLMADWQHSFGRWISDFY